MIDSKTINLRVALATLGASGLDRLYQQLGDELGVILTLHHVSPDPEPAFAPNTHLTVHPDFLRTVIEILRQRGFDFVTMDEAHLRIQNPQRGNRFAAFTVDDGYRDFLKFGVPVFESEAVPFALYIATGLIDGTGILWWRGLERVLQDNEYVEFDGLSGKSAFACETVAQMRNAFCHLEHHLVDVIPEDEVGDTIRAWCEKYDIDVDTLTSEAVVDWPELVELSNNALCTIGAHGVDHLALAKLDERTMRAELNRGVETLERKLGRKPEHLAYPFGQRQAAVEREFVAASEFGFKTAVTTRPGMIFPDHANHLTGLPRVSVNGWYQQPRYFSPLTTGLPTRLRQSFRRVDVD